MDNNMNVPNINQNMNNVNQSQVNNNANYGQQPVPQPVNQPVNNVVGGQAPKKNNTTTIIIIVVAILLIAVGVFAVTNVFMSDDKEEDKTVTDEKKDAEDKDEEKLLHEFSEYENYKFTMNITMGYMGATVTTSSNGTADVKNSTDYMVTIASYQGQTSTSYSYSDYKNGYTYTSVDKINWEAEETEGTESIKLADIINKINNKDTDVTDLGNGHYSVKVDFESEDMSYDGVYADVYVTNGYITKLSYDLTSLVASEGYTTFTIDFQLSDFNEAGDVVIPDSVTKTSSTVA